MTESLQSRRSLPYGVGQAPPAGLSRRLEIHLPPANESPTRAVVSVGRAGCRPLTRALDTGYDRPGSFVLSAFHRTRALSSRPRPPRPGRRTGDSCQWQFNPASGASTSASVPSRPSASKIIDGAGHRHRLRLRRASQDPQPARRRPRPADPRGAGKVPVAQQPPAATSSPSACPARAAWPASSSCRPSRKRRSPTSSSFEAKQQIPFNLDEVVWDYQKIGSGDRHRRLRHGDRDRPVRHEARHGQPLLAALQGRQRRGPRRADGAAGPVQLRRLRPARRQGRRRRRRRGRRRQEAVRRRPGHRRRQLQPGHHRRRPHHLAAADPAGRQPLHPRPDQGPQAHLRQGRAPQAQRHQVARPEEDPRRRSSRCSTISSARCSARWATSPTRTATPRSST